MNSKQQKKTTLVIDGKLLMRFKVRCAEEITSMSEKMRNLIQDYLGKKKS